MDCVGGDAGRVTVWRMGASVHRLFSDIETILHSSKELFVVCTSVSTELAGRAASTANHKLCDCAIAQRSHLSSHKDPPSSSLPFNQFILPGLLILFFERMNLRGACLIKDKLIPKTYRSNAMPEA